jgi:hypothetical protein
MGSESRTNGIHKILLILLLFIFCYFVYQVYVLSASIYHNNMIRDIGNI